MKNAMLFCIALLFSVSANAATLSLSTVGSNGATQEISLNNNSTVLAGGTVANSGSWESLFDVTTDVYNITGDFIFTAILTAGSYFAVDILNATSGILKYDLSISAVPVPAALWLFAPALLGFFGLRRQARKTVVA